MFQELVLELYDMEALFSQKIRPEQFCTFRPILERSTQTIRYVFLISVLGLCLVSDSLILACGSNESPFLSPVILDLEVFALK